MPFSKATLDGDTCLTHTSHTRLSVDESLQGMDVIRAFGAVDFFIQVGGLVLHDLD